MQMHHKFGLGVKSSLICVTVPRGKMESATCKCPVWLGSLFHRAFHRRNAIVRQLMVQAPLSCCIAVASVRGDEGNARLGAGLAGDTTMCLRALCDDLGLLVHFNADKCRCKSLIVYQAGTRHHNYYYYINCTVHHNNQIEYARACDARAIYVQKPHTQTTSSPLSLECYRMRNTDLFVRKIIVTNRPILKC